MKRFLTSPIGLACLLACPVLAFCLYLISTSPEDKELSSERTQVARNRKVNVGGVERPESDLSQTRLGRVSPLAKNRDDSDKSPEGGTKYESTFGKITCPKTIHLEEGKNLQMDSVLEAVKTKRHQERLSPYHDASIFDRVAWQHNPKVYRIVKSETASEQKAKVVAASFVSVNQNEDNSYLEIAEPARIYDTAQPDVSVPVLDITSNAINKINEGESIRLSVKTLPLAPASFTAFGVSKFENGLTTITVVADENGIASANLTVNTGGAAIDVVAGSPVASGTVRFRVDTARRAMY